MDGAGLERLRLNVKHESTVRELLQEFMVSSTPLVHQMERGMAHGRVRDVELAAHTLKSMAKLIGANPLAHACRTLEFAAHGATTAKIPQPMIEQVSLHLRDAQGAVARLLM